MVTMATHSCNVKAYISDPLTAGATLIPATAVSILVS